VILFSAWFRIGGRRVHVRPVDLLLLVVFAFGLAAHRSGGLARPNVSAAVAIAGFLAILAVHLGARLTALRAQRNPAIVVTLGLFGSAVETGGPGSTPRSELITGIVGAIVAAVCAGVVWLADGATGGFELLLPAAAGLAALQCLPALPLDAGRALWSLVWPVVDDDVQAARLVHRYGWVVVAGVALFGAVLFDRSESGPYWGLAAMASAVELAVASGDMVRRRAWRRAAKAVRLADAGAATVTTIDADRPIASAVEMLLALDHAGLLVVDRGEPVGALSDACLRRAPRATWAHRAVATIMTPLQELPQIDPELDVSEAVDLMERRDVSLARTTLGGRPALVTRRALRAAGLRVDR
jgi:CBS domain-containing protein